MDSEINEIEYEKIISLGYSLCTALDNIPCTIKGTNKLQSKIRQEIFCLEKVCFVNLN